MKNIKRVQIAFNLNDSFQKMLYDYMIEQGGNNVSSYGKLLVKKDMMGEWKDTHEESHNDIEFDENSFL